MKKLTYLWLGLILLYLLPAFVQPEFDENDRIKSIGLAMPRVLSGDEPAYLIGTYSLAKDLDLDLGNNYENSLKGSYEGGYNFKNKLIERHVRFLYNGKDYNNILFPQGQVRSELNRYDFSMFKQLPFHPVGLPLFAVLFLWPFKNSYLLESGAILLSIIMSLVGLFCLYKTLVYYKNDTRSAFLVTLLVASGTTLWFYSKTFFTEPYLTSLLLIAYYLFIVKKYKFLPAVFLSLGMIMKYPFVLFPAAFCLFLLFKRRIFDFVKFGSTVLLFGISFLLFNYSIYGFFLSQPYTFGNIIVGLFGIVFSPTNGILVFSPFLVFAFFGIKHFYRCCKNEALLTFALILIYYIFSASFHAWWGGGFAGRHMTPIMPLLGILLYFWLITNKSKTTLTIFYVLALTAVLINFQTAFFHFAFWGDKPPWQLIYLFATKFLRISTLLGFL